MNTDIKQMLEDAISETIDNVTSSEMTRQCELAWNRGQLFGLFWGIIIGIAIGGVIMKCILN